MAHIERTLTTPTDIHTVWNYITDFTTTEEWDPPTVRTERTFGDGGVGTKYHNVSSFLGSETEVDYTVTKVVPLECFELKGDAGKSMDLHDTITFERRPEGGTKLTYRAEFEPHGAAKLGQILMAPGLKILGDKVAGSLQEKLDALGNTTAADGSRIADSTISGADATGIGASAPGLGAEPAGPTNTGINAAPPLGTTGANERNI